MLWLGASHHRCSMVETCCENDTYWDMTLKKVTKGWAFKDSASARHPQHALTTLTTFLLLLDPALLLKPGFNSAMLRETWDLSNGTHHTLQVLSSSESDWVRHASAESASTSSSWDSCNTESSKSQPCESSSSSSWHLFMTLCATYSCREILQTTLPALSSAKGPGYVNFVTARNNSFLHFFTAFHGRSAYSQQKSFKNIYVATNHKVVRTQTTIYTSFWTGKPANNTSHKGQQSQKANVSQVLSLIQSPTKPKTKCFSTTFSYIHRNSFRIHFIQN